MKEVIQSILCGVSAVTLANLPAAEVCSNVRSMMDTWDNTAPAIPHSFTMTGTVHYANSSAFVFDDGDLLVQVLNRTDPHIELKTGNRIAISGNFGLKKVAYGDEPYTVALRAEILGGESPPAPVERTLEDLSSSRDNLRYIRTSGTIIDYRPDDADPDYLHLIMKDGATTMTVSVPAMTADAADGLVDAKVSVSGTFNRTVQGVRRYSRPLISASPDGIRIVEPATPLDSIPVLERKIYLTPKDILSLDKRKISGEIIAVWRKHNLLLRDDDDRIVRVRLSHRNRTEPRAGIRATVCGYPETDQFNIILGSATIACCSPAPAVPHPQVPLLSPDDIIRPTPTGSALINTSCYGKLASLSGTIRNLPSPGDSEGRIGLDCEGHLVQLDTSSCPDASEELELGCGITATGICLLEMNDYDIRADTPHISGLTIVLRGRDDISIVTRPPWLTPMRFFVVLTAMAGVLVLILFWNLSLRVLVERRGRELARREAETLKARLKTAERTRLATELHDAVVQNLTGAALEIRAAMASLDNGEAEASPHMGIALKTINSSRAELRNCIWDLRNQALEEKDIDEAIRITLQPHTGDTALQIRFNVPRRRIPDNEFHNIICIIRELVINAVRHGHARNIKIAGTLDNGRILFSVNDDGCGFDPASRPGMEQGHFGLEGVAERAKAMNGEMSVLSSPGRGTRVIVNIAMPEES